MLSEKMFLDIYQVIWHILQFIFDIVDICCRLVTFAKAKCKHVQRRFYGEDLSSEKHFIEMNKRNLTKIPIHLAVILGPELPDFRALSKIIIWCLSTGIPNITFYDHRGILVSNNGKVYDHLSRWRKDNDKICWNTFNGDICGSQVVYKNGLKKELSVNFVSPLECKRKIADVCRTMATDKSIQPEQITINSVHERCATIISPDPDAAIYFGDVCSTYGFLPWHIRLTEFFPIQSQDTMTVYSFMETLFKFSKCEQRFGY
ncbi:dehydrodolichyl diphosphate synthase complex subunit NUS1 [Contarinia nasturtii]|uniref:dehydrodolichyl diphosphate synthase complex subunit NUS1 n=1 Tax=Contarinia nasturtii TaxID=265458 RepID=UPI0012D44FB0|nr:dehydrodolichyl diphosphate synthase complex subunit NUS1 [Contarinia nasturtii]